MLYVKHDHYLVCFSFFIYCQGILFFLLLIYLYVLFTRCFCNAVNNAVLMQSFYIIGLLTTLCMHLPSLHLPNNTFGGFTIGNLLKVNAIFCLACYKIMHFNMCILFNETS